VNPITLRIRGQPVIGQAHQIRGVPVDCTETEGPPHVCGGVRRRADSSIVAGNDRWQTETKWHAKREWLPQLRLTDDPHHLRSLR
jgi:hypothetical protein